MIRLGVTAGVVVALSCAVVDRLLGHVAIAIVGALVVGTQLALAVLVAHELLLGRRLARTLAGSATEQTLQGTPVSIVRGLGSVAFVLGARRPRIFVGMDLLYELPPAQIRAVVAHELAHVHDRSPLRLALIAAVRRLLPAPAVRELLRVRAAEIECRADEAAVVSGASPAALAAALLRVEPPPAAGAGMGAVVAPRVAALAALAAGGKRQSRARAPVEWLLPLALWAAIPVCIAARQLAALLAS